MDVPLTPDVEGSGKPGHHTGMAQSLRLEGRTDATFDGGSFSTQGVRRTAATGCGTCTDDQCIHVSGTIVARYRVTTTVTLPRVSDFPDLTSCQRTRVQSAINNVLAPHEQQHVAAFRTYNGTTRTPFDVSLCLGEFDSTIASMFQTEASARQSSAQSASDALDPFHFDVDLNCEDRRQSTGPPEQPQSGEDEEVA
jgi:hypothetical protein